MLTRRLTALAILASLLIHLALLPPAFQWLEHRERSQESDTEPAPMELIVPLSDWLLPDSALPIPPTPESEPVLDEAVEDARNREAQLGYVRTAQNQESLIAPSDPSFISDRNARLQSPNPSTEGPIDLPNVGGDEEDTTDLERRRYRDGPLLEESPADPSPEPRPETAPSKAIAQQPPLNNEPEAKEATKDTGMLSNMLPELTNAIPLPRPGFDLGPPEESETPANSQDTANQIESEDRQPIEPTEPSQVAEERPPTPPQPLSPPPAPSTVPLPDRNVPAFQSETRQAKLAGSASKLGDAAFDTKNSPVGRYYKQVGVAVERKWQRNIADNHAFHAFAKIHVKFTVNQWGKAKNVEILQDKGNAVLTNQTVAAILEAKIPQMPADVVELLEQGELQCFFNFSIR